jgi:hypothetical protein
MHRLLVVQVSCVLCRVLVVFLYVVFQVRHTASLVCYSDSLADRHYALYLGHTIVREALREVSDCHLVWTTYLQGVL